MQITTLQSNTTDTQNTFTTTELISTTNSGTVTATETIETTTTTTTKTITSVKVTPTQESKDIIKTIEPRVVVVRNKELDKQSENYSSLGIDGELPDIKSNGEKTGSVNESKSGDKVIVINPDGKQKSGIMNIQSVCPTTKPGESKGTTVVVLNKDGAQMKINLSKKGDLADKGEDQKTESENGQNTG